MPTGARSRTTPLSGMGGYAVDARRSVRLTAAVVLCAWSTAGGTAWLAYLTLGREWAPIMVGVALCLGFAALMTLLHRALWLAVLSLAPAVFVLIGAVQYAPEAALERRGVRESVVIVADSADGADGSADKHRLALRTADGRVLEEKLKYDGDLWAPEVGDRLDVVRDPEGEVPMERAEGVDAASRLEWLLGGTVVWTLMALLAGRRGHVRRRRGRESLLLRLL